METNNKDSFGYFSFYSTLVVAVLVLAMALTYNCTRSDLSSQIKYYYIDKTGKKVLDGIGYYGDSFKEGLALVCSEYRDKYGVRPFRYIDHTGKTKFTISAYRAAPFSEGLASIQAAVPGIIGGCTGYVNKEGKWVIPPQFHGFGESFSDGLALASTKNGGLQYIDHSGKQQINATKQFRTYKKPLQAENLGAFSEGLALVRIGNYTNPRDKSAIPCQFGYINKSGEWKIKLNELEGTTFYEGLAKRFSRSIPTLQFKRSFIFIDTLGKEVLKLPYCTGNFSEGLCSIFQHCHYGYCNRNGQIVIKPQFETAGDFSEGLARVTLNGKVGYINTKGTMIINPQFAYAGDFSEGVALVVPFDKHHKSPELHLWGFPSGKYFARQKVYWINEPSESD